MNKTTKVVIGVLSALCLTLAYLISSQIPRATYEFRNPPKLLTPEVKVGEEVKWVNDICKLHNKDFYSQRTFFNLDTGRKYVIPEYGTRATLSKGECRVSEASQLVSVSLNIPAGKYELIVDVFVKSNRFSTDKFEYTVGVFTIK